MNPIMWPLAVSFAALGSLLTPLTDDLDQYQALVSKVTLQCSGSPSLAITPNTISYVYGANDTSGIPSVLASNHTTLLNGATVHGVQGWIVAFIGVLFFSVL